jgi:hypothetical protein
VFTRRISVVPGRVGFLDELSSGDCRVSRFWIASSYEVICEGCFRECKSLASVTFDADITKSCFDRNAFCGSGLTWIQIPSSVEMICEHCLSRCKSLASVTFDSDTKVSRLEGYAFHGSGLTSIPIPSSVEVICEHCFFKCKSLASVTHDPGSKLRLALSVLLTGAPLICRFSGNSRCWSCA